MSSNEQQVFTFSDNLVATLAKLVQVAILTGTDIYDHLKTVQCVDVDGQLVLSADFSESLNQEIASMLERASSLTEEK